MNKRWHETHKMPERATEEQRLAWHMEHAHACGCRPIPDGLMAKLSAGERKRLQEGRMQ
jgi:hypothetical protein